MPDFEGVTQLRYSNGSGVEQVVRFWRHPHRPCLDSGVLVCKETKVEVSRPLPVESETVHTLHWIGSQVVLEEQMQIVLCSMLELFMGHQILHFARHGLHMVHDQFIQIAVHMVGVNDELIAYALTSRIWVFVRHIDMLIQALIDLPSDRQVLPPSR